MANFSNRTNCVDDIKACDVNNLFLDITSTSSGHMHDGSTGRQHTSGNFKLKETSGCYNFVFVTSNIAADRNVTLPALSGNATFAFTDVAQSFTAATTFGADGSGVDVTFHSGTAGDSMVWDASEEVLNITGTNGQTSLDVLDGDVKIVDKLYFYDRGGEYMSSNGSLLTVVGSVTFSDAATCVDIASHDGSNGLKLGGTLVTTSAAELNIIDGGTARGTTTIADGDGVVINDAGTMRMTSVETLATYLEGEMNAFALATTFSSTVTLSSVANACADTDKFLVLDGSGNVDFRTGAEVRSDIGAGTGGGTMSSFQLEDDGGCEVAISDAKEVKFIGVGITTNWEDTDNGTDADPYDMSFTVNAAQTGISSIYNAALKVGRDCNNQICFATDDKIIFKAQCANEVQIIQNSIQPVTCNGAALGAVNQEWSDLFLACGAVINFSTGDVTLTHSGCALTLGGGVLDLGSNSLEAQTIDYTDGDNAITIADGGLMTFPQQVTVTKNIALTQSCTCGDYSGITAVFTAGEALERGEVVSVHTDGEVYKALAVGCTSGKINAAQPAIGVVVADASICAATTVLLHGFITCDSNFPTYTVGATLYVPEAEASCKNVPEGTAPDTDGDMVQVIGMAVKADSIYVNPDFTIIEVSC